MKLHSMRCPNCNGNLDINLENKEYIFCPYCGEKFFVEDGKKAYTLNQHINIKKDITIDNQSSHTSRTIDDAAVIRAKTEDREKKYSWLGWVGIFVAFFVVMGFCLYMMGSEDREVRRATEAGMISAGSHKDYQGEHFEAVVSQLDALGFENISCVDLDNAGILFWRNEKVDSVSIGGDMDFLNSDYFNPDAVVIIKYH